MLGIDVSYAQGRIDWEKLKKTDISFAIIKASQGKPLSSPAGSPFTDPRFYENVKGATGIHVPVGAYHYLCASSVQEAEREADYFLGVLSRVREDIALYAACDCEEEKYLPKDRNMLTSVVRAFCERVKKGGYKPILYTNPNYLVYKLNRSAVADIPMWLAYWNVPEATAKKYNPVIWQRGKKKILGTWTDVNEGYFTLPQEKDEGIRAGDRVKVLKPLVYGTNKKFAAYFSEYDVISVAGDRAVIGIGQTVTAAVDVRNLVKCGS